MPGRRRCTEIGLKKEAAEGETGVMGLYQYEVTDIKKTERIDRLVAHLFAKMPEIESARAKLITESYKETENEPIIIRRAKAFAHILDYIPITIREGELIVGSVTKKPRGCQVFPEFSYTWLEDEFDTISSRSADPFFIAEDTKKILHTTYQYWKGKTTSELATSYMAPEALKAIEHNIFTTGNYFYNGVGHVTVKYEEVLQIGYQGIRKKAEEELKNCQLFDADYAKKSHFLNAVILSCDAVIRYAKRYAQLAQKEAEECRDLERKGELLEIAKNCARVPEWGATSFYEACQSFWFIQMLLQTESSGHSISPGRFDQYMYPYYKKDLEMETGRLGKPREYTMCFDEDFSWDIEMREFYDAVVCGKEITNGRPEDAVRVMRIIRQIYEWGKR